MHAEEKEPTVSTAESGLNGVCRPLWWVTCPRLQATEYLRCQPSLVHACSPSESESVADASTSMYAARKSFSSFRRAILSCNRLSLAMRLDSFRALSRKSCSALMASAVIDSALRAVEGREKPPLVVLLLLPGMARTGVRRRQEAQVEEVCEWEVGEWWKRAAVGRRRLRVGVRGVGWLGAEDRGPAAPDARPTAPSGWCCPSGGMVLFAGRLPSEACVQGPCFRVCGCAPSGGRVSNSVYRGCLTGDRSR